jgi:DHA2 family multidrug resistance protein
MGNASGLYNLMRNIGGSIGISLAQTLLTRHTAVHQNEILNSVPITGRAFQNSLAGARHALTNSFGPANSLHPAQSLLYDQLHRQASLWAFVDVFRSLSLLSFFCVAVAWLFKKVKPGKPPAGAH